ncbi:MAG TPA: UbiD family decarboxylase [Acidisarcina sp.]
MKHLKDLREYLRELSAIGELVDVAEEVELDLEIGAIARRCYETGAPAALFSNIRGQSKGFRVLAAPAGVSRQPNRWLARIALSCGLPPSATGQEIVESLAAGRRRSPIKPRLVETGPCKENIHLGHEVNLLDLPAPLLHDGDGGRFINTFGIVVARTPDGSWTNWSIARIMVVDEKRMTGIVAPNQHLGMVHRSWADVGKPMPFALALGVEPFIPFVGGMPLPQHFDEADYIGGYFGEAVEVVRCETVELEVPSTAEIIVEGYLSNTATEHEGPMGEYAGYLWPTPPTQKPIYTVTAITHRNDAILPIAVAGEPPEENHTAWGIPNAAEIVHTLRSAGLPIACAWSPFASANHWYVIAVTRNWRQAVEITAAQLCERIGHALFATKAGLGTPKYIIVNDDIDITNLNEVVWAFSTRNHPGPQGELVFNNESTNPLVAFLDDAEKMSMHTTKVIYNCLPPDHWGDKLPRRSSFAGVYPDVMKQKVLSRWQQYGFPKL